MAATLDTNKYKFLTKMPLSELEISKGMFGVSHLIGTDNGIEMVTIGLWMCICKWAWESGGLEFRFISRIGQSELRLQRVFYLMTRSIIIID